MGQDQSKKADMNYPTQEYLALRALDRKNVEFKPYSYSLGYNQRRPL